MTDAILEARGLWRTYAQGDLQVHALRGVDLQVHAGDFLVLAGPSGSGKTTLLNQLGALDTPTKGQVLVAGEDLASKSKLQLSDLRRDKLGFVFQAYNLVPVLTAFENAELVLMLQGVAPAERKRRVDELLEAVGLGGLGGRFPKELSGGQQQRVAVARALASNPTVVLADEPTANLDSKTGEELVSLMRGLNEDRGVTFVFSSHDHKVMDQARRLVRMRDGQVEGE